MYSVKKIQKKDVLTKLGILMIIMFSITLFGFTKEVHAAVSVVGSGATAGGTIATASLSGLPANTHVVVGASCYGDGNYGLITPTGWTRTAYTQPGGGAGAVYFRYFTSAPTNTGFTCTGSRAVISWVAYSGADPSPYYTSGGIDPPNLTPGGGAVPTDGMWAAACGGRYISVGCRLPSGYSGQTWCGTTALQLSVSGYKAGNGASSENPDTCNTGSTQFAVSTTFALYSSEPQCNDGLDNDEDGLTDLADLSCSGPTDDDETNPPQCSDGSDNDGDGFTDFIGNDPGCVDSNDNVELTGPITYVRSGGVTEGTSFNFNIGSADADRLVVIIVGDERADNPLEQVRVDGKNATLAVDALNIVGAGNYQAMWYIGEAALGSSAGSVTIDITGGDVGFGIHALLYTGVADQAPTDTGFDNDTVATDLTVDVDNITNGIGDLIVMGSGQGRGAMTAAWTSPLVARSSGPGNPASADLWSASVVETAANTNKTYVATWSGNTDLLRGTGIVASWAPAIKKCQDGLDNDLDGATDYPADFSCSSATDDDETSPKSQCQDTPIDNDLDGFIDYPADLGCASAQDNNEDGDGSALSGYLISSTFDTGFANGVKINSIIWQGSLGVGGTNSVKFQIASSDCENGATDAGACSVNIGWGGSKSSGDGAFIGSDETSSTFYTPIGPNLGYAIPISHHNNKRYFRYKAQLDKDEPSSSPVVNDVIINWSP